MQYVTHNPWKTTLVRLCLTIAAVALAANSAPAQTYYYSTQPETYPTQTATPVYYAPTAYADTATWNGYAPQYYQATYATPTYTTAYTPQYTQATYVQEPAQAVTTQPAATGGQYTTASYAQPEAQPATTTAATTETTETTVASGDPYGFLGWLNATRAAYGLPAVGYDPNLESWAQVNNAQQAVSGMGHHVMGPARRQNAAMGMGFPGVESAWMSSPGHRAALLDPTIQWIGIAAYGAYWTFNAY